MRGCEGGGMNSVKGRKGRKEREKEVGWRNQGRNAAIQSWFCCPLEIGGALSGCGVHGGPCPPVPPLCQWLEWFFCGVCSLSSAVATFFRVASPAGRSTRTTETPFLWTELIMARFCDVLGTSLSISVQSIPPTLTPRLS